MKAVILAGGYGTRISEETHMRPKPMIEIGNKPIIWHILKIYSFYGINEFIICCGYKSYIIKEYFANYFLHTSDLTIDVKNNKIDIHRQDSEPWKITLVDTGEHTLTAGRIKRIEDYIKNDELFCLTYGDGVSSVNISKSIDFHKSHKKLATVTAVKPPGRFGSLVIDQGNTISEFLEKPKGDGQYINGGFFVLSPEVLSYIKDEESAWEDQPLKDLVKDSQLKAFNHDGFWQPMDTLRDKKYLESIWSSNKAPWKVWN